jgi:hypothetical protein
MTDTESATFFLMPSIESASPLRDVEMNCNASATLTDSGDTLTSIVLVVLEPYESITSVKQVSLSPPLPPRPAGSRLEVNPTSDRERRVILSPEEREMNPNWY